jgi:hypothetical protein
MPVVVGEVSPLFNHDRLIISTLVNIANLVETPLLWIHEFTLKMMQRLPAWSAPLFSGLWRFFFSDSYSIL